MKTLKEVFGLSIALLMLGGIMNTTQAQYKKDLEYYRPVSKDGIYMFTPNKSQKGIKYNGFKLYIGAGLTSQWQDLTQKTKGIDPTSGQPYSQIWTPIGDGFNLPTANLDIDAQLAQGMRLHLRTYLSSRHHNEAYVKGGYLRIDAMPMLHSDLINSLFDYVTIKIGDMEANYGDAHFLRTDNATALYNPLVGNDLMDSFTTMDGAEVYVMNSGFIGMIGMAGGMAGEKPTVQNPDSRRPSIYGKLGYDSKVGANSRIRLTASLFHSNRYTDLYAGDRAGARYYNIMADAIPGYGYGGAGDPHSGRVMPDFSNGFTSFMINPYVQVNGLHLFGLIESTKEMKTGNDVQQYAVTGQWFVSPNVYLAARYNVVHGYITAEGNGRPGPAAQSNSTVNRIQVGGGWFLTTHVLAKVEYVSQKYKHFVQSSVYNGGEFNGLMIEASIGF
ncbi:MAG TPA: hypothetical protein VKA34_11020 [Balneolales bacterium]|nr:hypothetical protein [Balneolales bacterium]